MTTLFEQTVLDLSNKEIRQRAAEKIEKQGKAIGCYQDDSTGACCTMGALRLVIFGRVDIWNRSYSEPRMRRYHEIVEEVAADLPNTFRPGDDPQIRIGKYNDSMDTEAVVRVLAGGE